MKTILLNDTSNECHIGSQQVIRTLLKYCEKHDIDITDRFTRTDAIKKFQFVKDKCEAADLVIINGEGTFHHYPRPTLRFFPRLMSNLSGKNKIVIINTVWQDVKYDELEDNLSKIDLISVRESLSYNELKDIYPENKLVITPDLIFDTEFEKYKIGYGDSVYQNDRSNLRSRSNYFPLTNIEQGTYEKPEVVTRIDIKCYLNWLTSLDLYVTGRFHGVCLALISGTSFLARKSNSHKIEGLLKDIDCEDLLLGSLDDIQEKEPLAKEKRDKKENYVKEAKSKINKLFDRISKL